jgi:hypothetical protein
VAVCVAVALAINITAAGAVDREFVYIVCPLGVLLFFEHGRPTLLECYSFKTWEVQNHWSVAHFQTLEAQTIGVLLI